ncbi:ABC transporter permease subunit [Escherichia coli]|uniref:ABC transporter permease subunit n=1 Tax=Escherichia coli TaxID=562 RepID=UPI003D9CAAF7
MPFLLKGAGYTLQLSIGGMFFGLLLGFILAADAPVANLARGAGWRVFYISIFRGTPLIAQLFMIYYGLPQFGIELDPIPSAMIGLSLNHCRLCCRNAAPPPFLLLIKVSGKRQPVLVWTPWQTMRRAIFATGGACGVAAAVEQLYQPGKRYVAGRGQSRCRSCSVRRS